MQVENQIKKQKAETQALYLNQEAESKHED